MSVDELARLKGVVRGLKRRCDKLENALGLCAAVLSDCVLFPEREDENMAYSMAMEALERKKGEPK